MHRETGAFAWEMPDVSERATVTVTIQNKLGLHARPAMTFVEEVNATGATVRVKRSDNDEVVDGSSIMQLMMLAATQGTELEITAEGANANDAIVRLKKLVERKFDEPHNRIVSVRCPGRCCYYFDQ